MVLVDKSAFCGGNSTKATSGINGAETQTQKAKQARRPWRVGMASQRWWGWQDPGLAYDLEKTKGVLWLGTQNGAERCLVI